MRSARVLSWAALAAIAAGSSCALILGAEELPVAIDGGTGGTGGVNVDGGADGADGGDAPDHDAPPDADGGEPDAAPGPCDCSPTGAWSKAFPATGDVTVAGVAVDSHGDVILAGSVVGDLDVDGHVLPTTGASHDVFVVKLDACGNHLWSRRFGDGLEQGALALAIDPRTGADPAADSVVITGFFSGVLSFGNGVAPLSAGNERGFVARLSAGGDGLAARDSGADAGGRRGTGVAVAPDGSVLWAGTHNGGASLFVEKLDPALSSVVNQIAPVCADCAPRIARTPAGAIAIAGRLSGKLNLAPGGVGELTSSGPTDVYVALLQPDPGLPFGFTDPYADEFGDPQAQAALGVAVGPLGTVFVSGAFAGELDFGDAAVKQVSTGGMDAFVAGLAADLKGTWAVSFGNAGSGTNQQAAAIAVSGARIAIAGTFSGGIDLGAAGSRSSAGLSDAFVARLDAANGAVTYAEAIGGAGVDQATGVALDPAGTAIVAGILGGPADFGCGMLGGSLKSAFVARRPLP